MPSPRTETPIFLITAGPNGAGKSSVYTDTKIEWDDKTIWIINPDVLTDRIIAAEKLERPDANLAAVERIERWLDVSIDVHKSIGVETVLSTPKYRRLVERAKQFGFLVWLIYVVLDTPERNIERVKIRVQKGGHDVPPEKIRERHRRSLLQLPWFLEAADRAWIFDNSAARPRLVAEKSQGVITVDDSAIGVVKTAVQSLERH